MKLSIITINLNNRDGLEETIRSVESQDFRDFEFIIIDGKSTDESVEVIWSHQQNITRWISEPDKGIYHAMNKGIRLAGGEYCLFLNSGDWLIDKYILGTVFSKYQDSDIIAGNMAYYDSTENVVKWIVTPPDEITANTLFNGTLPHQSTFIKRELFFRYGMYNESLQIASDWLFFLESLLEHKVTYHHIDTLISYFNMDGISCLPETVDRPRTEQLRVLEKKYPRFIDDYVKLKKLEDDKYFWESSKEYRVFKFLKKIGIIGLGVLVIRAVNFLRRKLARHQII